MTFSEYIHSHISTSAQRGSITGEGFMYPLNFDIKVSVIKNHDLL